MEYTQKEIENLKDLLVNPERKNRKLAINLLSNDVDKYLEILKETFYESDRNNEEANQLRLPFIKSVATLLKLYLISIGIDISRVKISHGEYPFGDVTIEILNKSGKVSKMKISLLFLRRYDVEPLPTGIYFSEFLYSLPKSTYNISIVTEKSKLLIYPNYQQEYNQMLRECKSVEKNTKTKKGLLNFILKTLFLDQHNNTGVFSDINMFLELTNFKIKCKRIGYYQWMKQIIIAHEKNL